MLLQDINYLFQNRENLDISHFYSILYEMVFVVAVMLAASLLIINRFSSNLRALFKYQLDSLEKVENGQYDTQVPIVSNDEFAIIAGQTNKMIYGLKERDFIRETFGRYVPKEISELILAERVPLDGELREVTVLFCDIRKYTTYAESKNPKQVVKKINEYFTEMAKAVRGKRRPRAAVHRRRSRSRVGAPVETADHPKKAVAALWP